MPSNGTTEPRWSENPPVSLFISYSQRDAKPLAQRLHRSLAGAGYAVFLDQTLPVGKNFVHEIDESIRNCDVMLALISKGSYDSLMCLGEHLCAIHLPRNVIPIKVYSDAPVPFYFQAIQWLDFSNPELQYEQRFADLLEALRALGPALLSPVAVKPAFFNVPPPPIYFVERPEELDALCRAALGDEQAAPAPLVALEGAGGVGKTSLAERLCQLPIIKAAFLDGIVWVQVRDKTVETVATEVGAALGDDPAIYGPATARNLLTGILRNKAALIVLDGVWEAGQVEPFWVQEPRSRTLFTTRSRSIAESFGIQPVRLALLSRDQSITLLRKWAGHDDPDFARIAKRLGDLPLALRIAGARMRTMRGAEWLREFTAFTDIQEPNGGADLGACFDLSLRRLTDMERTLCSSLGALTFTSPIPKNVVKWFWQNIDPSLRDGRCTIALDKLRSLALLDTENSCVSLHSLLHEFLSAGLGDRVKALDELLLNAYRDPPRPWHKVPNDGYLYNNISFHLMRAGKADELRRLLLDLDWLEAKLAACGVSALISDYDRLAGDAVCAAVQKAIRLSEGALTRDRGQLPAQLLGRLLNMDSPGIPALMAQAQTRPGLRPLRQALTSPRGPLSRNLSGHAAGVGAIAITGDGKRCVSGSDDCTLKVWRLRDGGEPLTLTGHRAAVKGLAWVDEHHVISSSDDCSLRIWDIQNGRELRVLAGHTAPVKAVAVALDGARAISGADDGRLNVWRLADWQLVRSLPAHQTAILAIAISANGKYWISGDDSGFLKIWDSAECAELYSVRAHKRGIWAVASCGKDRVVSASLDGTVKIWSLPGGEPRGVLLGHTNGVSAIAATPDGERVVSGGTDNTLRVWDLSRLEEIAKLEHATWVRSVALTRDGNAAICGTDDSLVRVWDLRACPAPSRRTAHRSRVSAVAIAQQGQLAVSASDDRTFKIWNVDADGSPREIENAHADRVTALAVTEDGRFAVSGSHDHTLKRWSLRDGKELGTMTGHSEAVRSVAMTPDGRLAVSVANDRMLIRWDLTYGSMKVLLGHQAHIRAVALTPSGNYAVSGSSDGTIIFWDLQSHIERCRAHLKDTSVHAVAMLPNGSLALSGSGDGVLRLWKTATGEEVHHWTAHNGTITALALSEDGQLAISASLDGTLKVWRLDPNDAKRIALEDCFTGDDQMCSCAIARDGKTVAAGETSGALHFFRLQQARGLVATAR